MLARCSLSVRHAATASGGQGSRLPFEHGQLFIADDALVACLFC